MSKLRVLDLFSGIGGFSLGLERTGGFETVAFCEIDPFCQKVLAKHWPDVRQYHDVRELTAERLAADGITVDVITGGFPCQDISVAGKGAGLAGERSGLWSEIARLVSELRPKFVIVENVSALLGRGLGTVLGDLSEIGYDAEWHCIPASYVGAHHRRDRVWIVAHPNGQWIETMRGQCSDVEGQSIGGAYDRDGSIANAEREVSFFGSGKDTRALAYPQSQRGQQSPIEADTSTIAGESGNGFIGCRSHVADASSEGWEGCQEAGDDGEGWPQSRYQQFAGCGGVSGDTWAIEPDVGRVAHGIPMRMDRLKSLGNSVVPQIPEMIGNAILQAEKSA